MENFVTFFNSAYLPQGLALHASMRRNISDFFLWILCADKMTYQALLSLNLEKVKLLPLLDLETEDLKEAKKNRNAKEYIWTLSPFAPRFVFESDPSVNRVTYIDADTWFLKDPKAIFREFQSSGKSVMITDHAYAPEFDRSETSGPFCVQFMIFTRDGEPVRRWWEERCLEWCHEYYEDGKLGDQRYLDDWPDRFPELVHVLQDKELILAPWNATRFPYGNAVVWHFHGLRLKKTSSGFKAQCYNYPLPPPTYQHVYLPYIRDLTAAKETLKNIGVDLVSQTSLNLPNPIKRLLRGLYHLRWKTKVDFTFDI